MKHTQSEEKSEEESEDGKQQKKQKDKSKFRFSPEKKSNTVMDLQLKM